MEAFPRRGYFIISSNICLVLFLPLSYLIFPYYYSNFQKRKRNLIGWRVFLSFLVFAVYLNALGNEFVSDDVYGILNNKQIDEISKVKKFFLKKLKEVSRLHSTTLCAWVILDTHYHLLVEFHRGTLVPKFIKHLHGVTARFIKQQESEANFVRDFFRGLTPFEQRQWRRINSATPSKRSRINSATSVSDELAQFIALYKPPPVWYQYTDHVIRDERDFYKHLNYIHQNPVKHGSVKKMGNYKFSSYRQYLKEKGREWLVDCFEKYPIVDFEPIGVI